MGLARAGLGEGSEAVIVVRWAEENGVCLR